MSGVIPPLTDPNDRPRPPHTHHLPHRRRRRRRYVGPLARLRCRDAAPGPKAIVLRPDGLERGWLLRNPAWRALLRRIIEEDSR